MDYAHALTRLPQLRELLVQGDGTLPADEAAELDQFSRSVPKLVSMLPEVLPDRSNVRHNAAVAEMTSKLVHHLDRTRPLAIVRIVARHNVHLFADETACLQAQAQIRSPFFGDAMRMRNIHSTMYEKFLRTVEVA